MARGRISYGFAVNLQQVVRESPTAQHTPQRTRPAPSASLVDEPAGLDLDLDLDLDSRWPSSPNSVTYVSKLLTTRYVVAL